MVQAKSVEDQLKKLHFNKGWNRAETDELATILLPDEEILECVSGWYEGGFALLCATNVRVLLIDKKPLKYLNIEDVRFDTINQIDYFHRMFNASICISTGLKKLMFRSYNQPRLRKLIGHVQHRMAEIKTVEQAERAKNLGNLEQMDQQLRAYMLSQYEQRRPAKALPEPTLIPQKITTENEEQGQILTSLTPDVAAVPAKASVDINSITSGVSTTDLYEDGIKEIFGKYQAETTSDLTAASSNSGHIQVDLSYSGRDAHALRIAYSKLPQILHARRNQVAVAT